MTRRFYESSDILTALTEINNIDSDSIDRNSLKPLKEINLTLPYEAELTVVKLFLSKEKNKSGKSMLETLFPVREGVKDTYHLLEAFETLRSSTAISEC